LSLSTNKYIIGKTNFGEGTDYGYMQVYIVIIALLGGYLRLREAGSDQGKQAALPGTH